mmetsp:Transcript_42108/g.78794  ORF Transcript_42108/g.78794 Transcript_42108/m.78794 type:complete len:327 (-) Transcript_42108:58-1038(-)
MEVKLLSVEGAVEDPDSIISLRAASLRRQGKPQVGVPLHFPVGIQEATPFKIDVLRQVGAGNVMVPSEGGDLLVEVAPPSERPEAPARSLKLRVTGMPQLCGRSRQELKIGSSVLGPGDQDANAQLPGEQASSAAAGKESSADPMDLMQIGAGATAQARQYFDEHNVMRVVQALLEALIRDQPAEPFEFIAAFMDSLSEVRRKAAQETQTAEAGRKTREDQEDLIARRSATDFGCTEWVCAFEAADPSGTGHINADAFCTAIQAVHPHLSVQQAQALCRGVAPGATGINLSGFCGAATAVSEGEAMAAEVAGISVEQFAELGRSGN